MNLTMMFVLLLDAIKPVEDNLRSSDDLLPLADNLGLWSKCGAKSANSKVCFLFVAQSMRFPKNPLLASVWGGGSEV